MINSSKTRLSRLNGDFEFSAYGYRFAPHTSAAVPASAESAKRHPIRIGSSQNAGRPTELGARTWAIAVASALFFFAVGAALEQQAVTTPTQAEKELEIKKKEVKQTELDLQKKRAELEKLKVALKYQETAQAININPDGSDNPEGRAQNRRVQITVEK